MFPDKRQPSLMRLIAKAKEYECCCKFGRGIGFTEVQVQEFFEQITVRAVVLPSRANRPKPVKPLRPGSEYERVWQMLVDAKRANRVHKNRPS